MEYLIPMIGFMIVALLAIGEMTKAAIYHIAAMVLIIFLALMVGQELYYLASAALFAGAGARTWSMLR